VGWKNRKSLPERVAEAAERSLTAQNYVSPIDVLMRIGWLAPDAERRWRQGRTDSLECVAQVGISRLSEAITLLRSWASEKDLFASSTDYVSRTPQRQQLRFSRSQAQRRPLLPQELGELLADPSRKVIVFSEQALVAAARTAAERSWAA